MPQTSPPSRRPGLSEPHEHVELGRDGVQHRSRDHQAHRLHEERPVADAESDVGAVPREDRSGDDGEGVVVEDVGLDSDGGPRVVVDDDLAADDRLAV